jgi:hypothetical protein
MSGKLTHHHEKSDGVFLTTIFSIRNFPALHVKRGGVWRVVALALSLSTLTGVICGFTFAPNVLTTPGKTV